ncbi:hypothetical protein ON010_g7939 [Phytophthora cinnamomi]|nr:hypothetical protein ON010_g7939 [Phytophthora cinnamomi]
MARLPHPDAPILPPHQVGIQNAGTNRVLRGVEEERQITVTSAVGTIASSIKKKVELKVYLLLGLTPEKVRGILKVTSREDKNFGRYSKYFFRYYVKYLDASISHLPTSTVEDIMKARLSSWLDGLLTPPQVFPKLGLTGTWDSARGEENFKYFLQYGEMYSDLQVRESKRINGLEKYAKTTKWTESSEARAANDGGHEAAEGLMQTNCPLLSVLRDTDSRSMHFKDSAGVLDSRRGHASMQDAGADRRLALRCGRQNPRLYLVERPGCASTIAIGAILTHAGPARFAADASRYVRPYQSRVPRPSDGPATRAVFCHVNEPGRPGETSNTSSFLAFPTLVLIPSNNGRCTSTCYFATWVITLNRLHILLSPNSRATLRHLITGPS